jgi:hypothetical protein
MAAESRIELWQAAGDYLRGLLAFDDLYVLAIRLAPALIGDAVACELAGKIVFAKVDGLSADEARAVVLAIVRRTSRTHIIVSAEPSLMHTDSSARFHGVPVLVA